MITSQKRHLYIAGFMGTGKSTIGPLVAGRLGHAFHDLDSIVESLAGRSTSEIFRIEGEPRFREYEVQALESIVEQPPSVIALGGGAPTIPRVAELVCDTGWAVLLTADHETIFKRLGGDTSRPLLKGKSDEPMSLAEFKAKVETLMPPRRDAYADIADWIVDTSQRTSELTVERIIKLVATTIRTDRS